MKQVFICSVMIFSLLVAVCGCSNDLTGQEPVAEKTDVEGETPHQPTNTEPVITVPEETVPVITIPNETEPEETEPVEIEPEETEPTETGPEGSGPNIIIPEILINELRTEYSSSAKHAEFIEFKVKTAGNLQGIKLYIMWDAKKPYIFPLPSIEVKAGEYITYHLRTLESENVDELGENLSISGGTDSCPTARDLWISGNIADSYHPRYAPDA